MAAHSKLGASSSSRWMACPGSVRLSEGLEQVTSPYAEEGTFAHNVAAYELENGHLYPDDIPAEMRAAIDIYKEALAHATKDPAAKLWIEVRFDLSLIYPGMFGTADAVVYDPHSKILKVYDFKYGAGIPVEVSENKQLMYYALGAALNLRLPTKIVELWVVQPRCPHDDGPVRGWACDTTVLLSFAADLEESARRTEDPNAPLVPGDHCRFCLAKAQTCPAIQAEARALAKLEFKPEWSYDPNQLAKALKFIPALKSWMKSVEEFAFAEANHGRPPPGFKLVKKRQSRSWKDEANALTVLGGWLPRERFMTPESLKTPAQIERDMNRKERLRLSQLTTSESKGVSLVPASDRRPEIKTDAKSEFQEVGSADLLE